MLATPCEFITFNVAELFLADARGVFRIAFVFCPEVCRWRGTAAAESLVAAIERVVFHLVVADRVLLRLRACRAAIPGAAICS